MTSRQPTTTSASAGPSRTLTLTSQPPPPAAETDGILRLRPESSSSRPAPSRRVVWTDETVDNEGMGRKKSKICCIYHKPKAFDESSDESSSDASDGSDSESSHGGASDSSDDGPSVSKALKEKLKQREGHGHAEHEAHEGCSGRKSRQKAKGRVRSSAGTQTNTEEAADGGRAGKEESDAEDDGREFRPNAYERGTR